MRKTTTTHPQTWNLTRPPIHIHMEPHRAGTLEHHFPPTCAPGRPKDFHTCGIGISRPSLWDHKLENGPFEWEGKRVGFFRRPPGDVVSLWADLWDQHIGPPPLNPQTSRFPCETNEHSPKQAVNFERKPLKKRKKQKHEKEATSESNRSGSDRCPLPTSPGSRKPDALSVISFQLCPASQLE